MKKRRHMPMTRRKEKKERVTEIECKTSTYNKPRGDEPDVKDETLPTCIGKR
jgi:hypothetical protein